MALTKVTSAQQAPNKVEKKEVKINQESNRQENASPSKSTFDLNDYWNQGYKEDTEEQNEEVAKKIRHDILSRYDIEDDDSNKEDKLVRIYLDILDDEKNKALKDNLGDDANYKGDDEDFIDDVEKMMAHMTHDNSSVGDKVRLSEVDFSDIEYNDEPKSGMMETKTVNNGFEYTIYDENGHVEKFISKTVDDNGLTTISTYSDADKTDLISKEEVFEFLKSDDEVKYKFAGGNQNTVDFKDNGDSIAVEITKGEARENLTLEKNADGTYSFDGKQFFTIEEAAIAMNAREIKGSEELDGILSATSQGKKMGDCALLSALNSLNATEFGRQALKDAITFDSEGNATVNFKGLNEKYTITKADFKNASKYSTGDLESRIFEIAWGKHLTNNNLKGNYQAINGTYSSSVYKALTGIDNYPLGAYSDDEMLKSLDNLEKYGNMAITAGNIVQTPKGSESAVSGSYKNIYGEDIKLYNNHSYAVKESDTLPNGKRVITIIDPYDSSKEIVIDQHTYLQAFTQTDDVELFKV